MFKKVLSLAISAVLFVSVPSATALAAEPTVYSGAEGSVLMAYNYVSDSEEKFGSFSFEGDVLLSADGNGGEPAFPTLQEAEDLGYSPFEERCGTPELEDLGEPILVDSGEIISADHVEYQVGDTKQVYDSYRPEGNRDIKMECVYIGKYCTVWNCTNDAVEAQLPENAAKYYADGFDRNYTKMVSVFGNWFDVDKDGKVAIFCYDIGDSCNTEKNSGVNGYFSSANLLDGSREITNSKGHTLRYAGSSETGKYLEMDCIHVETASKQADDFEDETVLKSRLSTILHEFQHLINYSWTVENYNGSNYGTMESLMNEGMSRAAQFLTGGEDYVMELVSSYNNNVQKGQGLFNWTGSSSQYLLSFLLQEYMRTSYARTTNAENDGYGIFLEIQKIRVADMKNSDDTLGMVAKALFGMEKSELVYNMWKAVYCQADTGPLGYNREAWAKKFLPPIEELTAGTADGIQNGGVRFYLIDGGEVTVKSSQNLKFEVLGKVDGVVASGEYGESSTWELTRDGRMFVEGSGVMKNYAASVSGYLQTNALPWYAYRGRIRSIEFEDSITTVGDCAFYYATALRSVKLPEKLESIGQLAFCNAGLREIDIPAKVVAIYNRAFLNVPNLRARFFGNGVNTLLELSNEQYHAFESTAVLQYLKGRSDWTDAGSSIYDAEKGTWKGYRLECWGAVGGNDDDVILKVDSSGEVPSYTLNSKSGPVLLVFAGYDSNGRMLRADLRRLEAAGTVSADWPYAAAEKYRGFVLSGETFVPLCPSWESKTA